MSKDTDVPRTFEQGVAEHRAGRLAAAERLYRQVLAGAPNHEHAAFLIAAISIETGRAREAVALLEPLVQRQPGNAVYFTNLGEAYRRLEDYENAASTLLRAVTLQPDLAQAHFNLGLVTRKLGEDEVALQAFERATDLKPDNAQMQHGLSLALSDRGDYARAIGHFQCALALNPQSADLLIDYARCLRKLRRFGAALASATRAVALSPGSALAHHEMSASFVEQGRFDDALQSSRKALSLQPDLAAAHCGFASALADSGMLDEAIAAYRTALTLDPSDYLAHSNLIFLLPFHSDSRAQSILDEARRWEERHTVALAKHGRPHSNNPEPERKLRVGYLSSNYDNHCQALFTLPLFDKHDRSTFELHAYSSSTRADHVTKEIRARFEHWHEIAALGAVEAAEQIRSDGIDILVDLTMHMSVSQLRIFACKPAPVQIAWLAYPGTTGLTSMDYRVTDRHLDPPELPAEPYSEASLVLPDTFWCYHPGLTEPPVSELPALSKNYLTFGCLNTFWKLNEATLRLWGKVLERVPSSRLMLLAPEGSSRARVTRIFEADGIDPSRIQFVSRRARPEYLKLYEQIDVCLDALPYNGHTTSLDAFWMGVPVVTLVGNTVVGRAGMCQALNLGLPELIAKTADDFVSAAARLAEDLDGLAKLRAGLRARLELSPLMDAERFARNLEAKYREVWRVWCRRGQGSASADGSPVT